MNISIHDAAALLIQLEPDDAVELTRYHEMLKALSGDVSYPESSRNKIAEAMRNIAEIIAGKSLSPDKSMEEAGKQIQEAIYLMEQDQTDEAARDGEDMDTSESEGYISEDMDPELLAAFITESGELIIKAEEALLSLENNPDDTEAVGVVFRAIHTIKGTSAFFNLALLTELSHRAESFLSRIRDKEIRYSGGYADLALRSVDMIKDILNMVKDILENKPFVKPDGYDSLMITLKNPESEGISDKSAVHQPAPVSQEENISLLPIQEEEISADKTEESDAQSLSPKEPSKQSAESSVRVPIERLDRFIDMVGELVVAHSMVVQDEVLSSGVHYDLVKKVAHTSKIVRELQSMSMSMRMIPLKATFRKMARLVRDLARKTGKNISFVTDGEDTEIDRNMVDFINDPLIHMVRNAIDHGIEAPDERGKTDKPPVGTIQLSAYHSASNVVVEIRDDGKGFDRDIILNKAIERGLFNDDPEILAAISDREVYNLIFEPGFSTAKIVSDISGRGVGMDVVRKNVEALRGQIEIQSQYGHGSIFKMNLPLTLAIIDGMVVRVGRQTYVAPTLSIVRSVQPKPEDITTVLKRGEMLLLQGNLIPLFRLASLFEISGAEEELTKSIVMVVEDDGKQVGLIIDELIGSQQIVIKTLGEIFRNIPGISGSAIMPNGRVGLILDVGGLVRLANGAVIKK